VCGWDDTKGLPIGKSIPDLDNIALRSGIEVYNYDNTFRDKETTGKHFLRFSDARERAGFKREWGTTTEGALRKFQDMMAGRMKKTNGGIRKKFKEHGGHPKYIKDRIKKLTEDKFGYNQWK
jgi:hypothetical protein